MNTEHFVAGTRIEMRGQLFVSHGCALNGIVKLANPKLKTSTLIPREKLFDMISMGRAKELPREETGAAAPACAPVVAADLSTLKDTKQAEALRKLGYVNRAMKTLQGSYGPAGLTKLIEEVSAETSDSSKPHWRTVITWIQRYEKAQVHGLVNLARGNTHSRVDDVVEDLMYLAITGHYLQPARLPLTATHLHLQGLIEKENLVREKALWLVVPSYRTLKRRVADFDRYEVMCARFGRQYALNWFRTRGIGPRATRPFEVVQMDHTTFDAEVVFKQVLRLGKPTLTLARDEYTGGLCGLYLGFDPAGYQPVMECLLTTILNKNLLTLAADKLKHPWLMSGIPESLKVDNGAEFQGHDLRNACAHLGIDLVYCPPRQPWFKPHIERLFGVLRQQFTSRLQGKTYTVREDAGEHDVREMPLIDLDDLQRILVTWAVNVFNETPWGVTGMPPRVAWEQSVQEYPVRNDLHPEEIRIFCGRTQRRSLHPYGIELYGLIYASEQLSALRQHIEQNARHISRGGGDVAKDLLVKYDPRDMGRVWVLDPITNTYLAADAVRKDYAAGVSLHRHRLNLQLARQKAKGYVDAAGLLEANQQIDVMIDECTIPDAERLRGALARAFPNAREPAKSSIHEVLDNDVDADLDVVLADHDLLDTEVYETQAQKNARFDAEFDQQYYQIEPTVAPAVSTPATPPPPVSAKSAPIPHTTPDDDNFDDLEAEWKPK